jgi:hypothetical protein
VHRTLRLAGLAISCVAATVLLGLPARASARPSSGQDRALAQSAVLQLRDFPAGWNAGPRTDNAQSDRIRARIPECKRYQSVVAALRRQPEASANFIAQNSLASSTVIVLNSVHAAQSTFGQLTSSTVLRCLQRYFGTTIAQSIFIRGVPARLQTVTGSAAAAVQAGDATAAFQVTVTLSAGGLTAPVYADVDVVRIGRSIAEFGFENPNASLPARLRDALVNAVVGRLAAAR